MGVGHLSAARAVASELSAIDPAVETPVVDSYKYAALVVSRVVSDGYLRMVKTIPQMYRYIYHRAERATEVGRFRTWAHQFTATNLRPLMLRERPDAVVCTHAFPCGAMAEYKRMFPDAPPIVAVVTDFAVHGFWIHDNVDRYVIATEAMRGALLARGVRPAAILVSGIPVRAEFARTVPSRGELRERLNLSPERKIVLLMGGGLGIAPIERMLAVLRLVRVPLTAVVVAGKNARMARRLSHTAESVEYPVRALRWVDNVYDYMHASDVLVTKPGGLTTAEALVARIPMVLSKPLPGQEERNARFLADAGVALRAAHVDELPPVLERLLCDASTRERTIAAAARIRRPNAASEAAAMIAGLVQLGREVVA